MTQTRRKNNAVMLMTQKIMKFILCFFFLLGNKRINYSFDSLFQIDYPSFTVQASNTFKFLK